MTLVFFNNLRLKRWCLFKYENNQFKLVAIRPDSLKKHSKFWQSSFLPGVPTYIGQSDIKKVKYTVKKDKGRKSKISLSLIVCEKTGT